MKIFAFADLHGDLSVLKKIAKKVKKEKPKYIICAGDLSIFGSHLDLLSKELDKMNIPVFMFHGNHEDEGEINVIAKHTKNIKNMHNRYEVDGKYIFLGYGGGGFALFNKDFEKTTAKKFKAAIKKLRQKYKNAKVVFMTHGPPYNTKLDQIHGNSAGCKSLRKFIKEAQPDLVICGHLHENVGKKDQIGKSKLVNVGWEGMFFDI
ncbi:metallophosphoesterase [Candidatus Woesearchaeota archaeon]|nr:metallophosphoesterase [Candidatus Woesearchaeota archaeon]